MRYLAFILAALTSAEMQAFGLAPKLVVNVTVDELRSDYMEAFYPMYGQNGFRRLLSQGLVYEGASFPSAPIDRASAVATLSTGSFPYLSGIISSQWLDRETLQPVNCVSDTKYVFSPSRLRTSTLGDELKLGTDGRAIVYSLSADKESAILAAGHAANGAFWLGRDGHWQGTSYYGQAVPSWLKAYDSLRGNYTSNGTLTNDEVVSASLQAVTSVAMGKDAITDMLYVTLSAANTSLPSNHGREESAENVYLQLDKSIASLVTGVERQVGVGDVLFVFTSTGYSSESPVDLKKFRIPTGTFYINRTANLLNMYLSAIYGQGRYVEQCFYNQMYLNRKLIEQKRISLSDVFGRSEAFLIQCAGVADVYTSERLLSGNDDIRKIRNGYNPSASGDIIVALSPGWQLLNEDTHQTWYSSVSFMPFPVIFMGGGITHEVVKDPVSVDRIAPTIAKAIRIRAPNACSSIPLF